MTHKQRNSKIKISFFLIAIIVVASCYVIFYSHFLNFYTSLSGKNSLVFENVSQSSNIIQPWIRTFSVSIADINGDDYSDILVNNHDEHLSYLYRNKGDGTFANIINQSGIWENNVGPIFGQPENFGAVSGYYVWLDSGPAINGNWHIRWVVDKKGPRNLRGTITTNTEFKTVNLINISDEAVSLGEDTISFDVSEFTGTQGLDLISSWRESTIKFELYIDNKIALSNTFIGPNGVNPKSLPFALSLGDRHATAWADFNNDGQSDLFITRGAMTGVLAPPQPGKYDDLFINAGNATFQNVITESEIKNDYGRGRSAQWFDFNKDGNLDIYITNFNGSNLLYLNNDDGTFTNISKETGLDFVKRAHFIWADLNNDSYVDVLFTNPNGLFFNNGAGQFKDVTASSGLSDHNQPDQITDNLFWGSGASLSDYDNDGDLDVFIASGKSGGNSALYRNDTGQFVDVTQSAGLHNLPISMESVWADYDNDGLTDLYLIGLNPEKSNRLLRNTGPDGFIDVTDKLNLNLVNRLDFYMNTLIGGSALWLDYNNDGFLDLFITGDRARRNKNAVEPNNLTSLFMNGIKKIVHGKTPGYHFLFQNKGNLNHWLKIKLTGTTSNRDGIGAKIIITTPNGKQYQEAGVLNKTMYTQNSTPTHFGLGRADRVKQIDIIWPSGIEQKLIDIKSDQLITINEPIKQI